MTSLAAIAIGLAKMRVAVIPFGAWSLFAWTAQLAMFCVLQARTALSLFIPGTAAQLTQDCCHLHSVMCQTEHLVCASTHRGWCSPGGHQRGQPSHPGASSGGTILCHVFHASVSLLWHMHPILGLIYCRVLADICKPCTAHGQPEAESASVLATQADI